MQHVLNDGARQAAELGGQLTGWVRCLETGKTAAVDADQQVPSASTIKVLVMIELFRQARLGKFSLTDTVHVTNPWKAEGSGVLKELDAGLKLSVWDLVTLMIIVSDNVAANLCIDLIGLDAVNNTIRDLGMTRTALRRKFLGRPASAGADNVTTAADMGHLMERLARSQMLGPDDDMDMVTIMRRQQDKAAAAFYVPTAVIAHKTGLYEEPPHAGDVGIVQFGRSSFAFALYCSGTESTTVARLLLATLMQQLAEFAGRESGVTAR
jgi:beta-lactamase class A